LTCRPSFPSTGLFKAQLKSIISRRKFGVCIKVVDGVDFEGSIIPSMRKMVGNVPVLLVINKVNLSKMVGFSVYPPNCARRPPKPPVQPHHLTHSPHHPFHAQDGGQRARATRN
jgi:hypothetical protein